MAPTDGWPTPSPPEKEEGAWPVEDASSVPDDQNSVQVNQPVAKKAEGWDDGWSGQSVVQTDVNNDKSPVTTPPAIDPPQKGREIGWVATKPGEWAPSTPEDSKSISGPKTVPERRVNDRPLQTVRRRAPDYGSNFNFARGVERSPAQGPFPNASFPGSGSQFHSRSSVFRSLPEIGESYKLRSHTAFLLSQLDEAGVGYGDQWNEYFKKAGEILVCALPGVIQRVLEHECGDMWIDVVKIPPPWKEGRDILAILDKHWLTMFKNAFPRVVEYQRLELDGMFKRFRFEGGSAQTSLVATTVLKEMFHTISVPTYDNAEPQPAIGPGPENVTIQPVTVERASEQVDIGRQRAQRLFNECVERIQKMLEPGNRNRRGYGRPFRHGHFHGHQSWAGYSNEHGYWSGMENNRGRWPGAGRPRGNFGRRGTGYFRQTENRSQPQNEAENLASDGNFVSESEEGAYDSGVGNTATGESRQLNDTDGGLCDQADVSVDVSDAPDCVEEAGEEANEVFDDTDWEWVCRASHGVQRIQGIARADQMLVAMRDMVSHLVERAVEENEDIGLSKAQLEAARKLVAQMTSLNHTLERVAHELQDNNLDQGSVKKVLLAMIDVLESMCGSKDCLPQKLVALQGELVWRFQESLKKWSESGVIIKIIAYFEERQAVLVELVSQAIGQDA